LTERFSYFRLKIANARGPVEVSSLGMRPLQLVLYKNWNWNCWWQEQALKGCHQLKAAMPSSIIMRSDWFNRLYSNTIDCWQRRPFDI